MRFSTILAGVAVAASSLVSAAPTTEANSLFARAACPRVTTSVAAPIANLYLGVGNNKSRQIQRLIEETVAYLIGCEAKCTPDELVLDCPSPAPGLAYQDSCKVKCPKLGNIC